jgi:hypothetical protein
MSILRSGEILLNNPEGGGGALLRDPDRAGALERAAGAGAEAGGRARPERAAEGLDFLREAAFERVIGMAKSLYCLLAKFLFFRCLRSTRTAYLL